MPEVNRTDAVDVVLVVTEKDENDAAKVRDMFPGYTTGIVHVTGGDSAATEHLSGVLSAVRNAAVGIVLFPEWNHNATISIAAVTAAALDKRLFLYDGECVEQDAATVRQEVFTTLNTCTHIASPRAEADDSTPDENRGERPHEEAARIVLGPRGSYYDHPYDNFMRTGYIWTGVLYSKLKDGETVSPEDVALCMNGVKMAREAYRHKRDNLTDGHGYWMAHEMVVEERQRRERDSDST